MLNRVLMNILHSAWWGFFFWTHWLIWLTSTNHLKLHQTSPGERRLCGKMMEIICRRVLKLPSPPAPKVYPSALISRMWLSLWKKAQKPALKLYSQELCVSVRCHVNISCDTTNKTPLHSFPLPGWSLLTQLSPCNAAFDAPLPGLPEQKHCFWLCCK